MQAQGSLFQGGMIGSFIDIYQQEGTRGLWRVSTNSQNPPPAAELTEILRKQVLSCCSVARSTWIPSWLLKLLLLGGRVFAGVEIGAEGEGVTA